MIYLQLFLEFFKMGLFAVGGGLATIPFLYELTEKYTWFSKEILGDMIAISESTPGPIGVNMATYAGVNAAGVLGGITATLGLICPSVIIVLIVAKVFQKFKESKLVKNAFSGIRPAVTGMLASVGIGILLLALFGNSNWKEITFSYSNIKSIILFVIILILSNKIKIHPIFYILAGGIVGAIFSF